jgi:hypothetical protein
MTVIGERLEGVVVVVVVVIIIIITLLDSHRLC